MNLKFKFRVGEEIDTGNGIVKILATMAPDDTHLGLYTAVDGYLVEWISHPSYKTGTTNFWSKAFAETNWKVRNPGGMWEFNIGDWIQNQSNHAKGIVRTIVNGQRYSDQEYEVEWLNCGLLRCSRDLIESICIATTVTKSELIAMANEKVGYLNKSHVCDIKVYDSGWTREEYCTGCSYKRKM